MLLLPALAGCTLIDQRTFNPEAGKRPVVAAAPVPPVPAPLATGPPPLLRIRLPAGPELGGEIAKAVAAARARKRDVAFEVVEIVPGTGENAGRDAGNVARLIESQGVPAARVRLAARPAPGAAPEVRVYVR